MSKTTEYQLMWILPGTASRADIDASMKQVDAQIKERKGSVRDSRFWGQRTLAYSINKNDIGNYCITNFTMDSSQLPSLKGYLEGNLEMLRHMIAKI